MYNIRRLSPMKAKDINDKQWFYIPPAVQTKPPQAKMRTNKSSNPKKHRTQIHVIPQHHIMPLTIHGMPDALPYACKRTAQSSCTSSAKFCINSFSQ
jgi:hypothetical protein